MAAIFDLASGIQASIPHACGPKQAVDTIIAWVVLNRTRQCIRTQRNTGSVAKAIEHDPKGTPFKFHYSVELRNVHGITV